MSGIVTLNIVDIVNFLKENKLYFVKESFLLVDSNNKQCVIKTDIILQKVNNKIITMPKNL